MKKLFAVSVLSLFALNLIGCAPVTPGSTADIGTAGFYYNKLVSDMPYAFEEVELAVEKTMEELQMPIYKETKRGDFWKFTSTHFSGSKTWISLEPTEFGKTRLEIRVGYSGDEFYSRDIYSKVMQNL